MKVLLLLLLVPGLLAYKHFQERIPNGDRVPHPCKPNFVWQGVGHMNKNGGGMRNKFGDDFASNGHIWDKCMCETDSDGDGRSNGEELGDPDCKWVPGAQPKVTALSKISHPGICDPHDSEDCKRVNNWEFCEQTEFKCDHFQEEGVKNFTIRLDKTAVPAAETTYMCQMFDIPSDGDWHVIGAIPAIDNANVMHHTVVSLCTDEEAALLKGAMDTPVPCGTMRLCSGSLNGWTVGIDGQCMKDTFGYRIGRTTGYTKAVMELHWNNPEGVTNYEDASGMTYFYTEKLRQYDLSVGATAPAEIHIPPKQLSYEQTAICTPECSAYAMNGTTRYIADVLPHMHYLGRGFVMEHWRDGKRLEDLVNTNSYSYDNPVYYRFDPPRELRPGDQLITRCIYNSMSKEKRTYYGEGTNDEMCFGFMSLYPGPPFACAGTATRSLCYAEEPEGTDVEDNDNDAAEAEEVCNLDVYFDADFKKHFIVLAAVCDPDGLVCEPGCKEALGKVHNHPCLKGDSLYVFRFYAGHNHEYGVPFLHLLSSCHEYQVSVVNVDPPATPGELCPAGEPDPSAATRAEAGRAVTVLAAVLIAAAATWM